MFKNAFSHIKMCLISEKCLLDSLDTLLLCSKPTAALQWWIDEVVSFPHFLPNVLWEPKARLRAGTLFTLHSDALSHPLFLFVATHPLRYKRLHGAFVSSSPSRSSIFGFAQLDHWKDASWLCGIWKAADSELCPHLLSRSSLSSAQQISMWCA